MAVEQVESVFSLRQIPRPEWRLVRAVSVLERSLLIVDPSLRNAEGKVVSIGEIVNERYRDFFGDDIRRLNWALGIRNDVIHATGDDVTRLEIERAAEHVINALETFAMSLNDELFGGLKTKLTGRQRKRKRGQRRTRSRRTRRHRKHWSRRRAPSVIARSRAALIVPLVLLAIIVVLLVLLAPPQVSEWRIEIPTDEPETDDASAVEQTLDEHIETRKQHAKLLLIAKRSPVTIADGGILREAWVTVCSRLGQSFDVVEPMKVTREEQSKLPDSLAADFPPHLLVGPGSLFTQSHHRLLSGQHPVSKDATEVERFRYFVYCIGQSDIMTRAEQQGITYDWEGNLCPNHDSRRLNLARLFRVLVRSNPRWLAAGTQLEQSERWAEYNWARSGQRRLPFWYPSLIVELSDNDLSRALVTADDSEVA